MGQSLQNTSVKLPGSGCIARMRFTGVGGSGDQGPRPYLSQCHLTMFIVVLNMHFCSWWMACCATVSSSKWSTCSVSRSCLPFLWFGKVGRRSHCACLGCPVDAFLPTHLHCHVWTGWDGMWSFESQKRQYLRPILVTLAYEMTSLHAGVKMLDIIET